MARQRRLNEPGSYHHITARGVDRCKIFVDDGDRRQFLSLMRESHERFGCRILAFCLMDNHVHLTVLDDEGTLSKTLHFLNGVYAKKFNLRHGRTGHLFERRFWSSILDSDSYLVTCVKYVHRNPLEAGMVSRIEDHRWSSYPSYVGVRTAPTFLDTGTVLAHYGNDPRRLQLATEAPSEDSVIIRQLGSSNPPPVLGRSDLAPPRRSMSAPTGPSIPLEEILIACAHVTRVPVAEVRRSTPGRRNEARGLAAFIAHRHVGHTLTDIAASLGLSSSQGASALCQRFARQHDEVSQALVDAVVNLLTLASPTC